MLTPGLISTHAHIAGSPLDRSFIEDTGRPQFYYSGLFETLPVRSGAQDEAASRACVDFSMAELLRGGVTTVLEIGQLGDHVAERAAHFGLRVYVGLSFRSGSWLTPDGRRVRWEWDEEQGHQGLARAIQFHQRHEGAHGDLVRACFAPAQVDTCTPELLRLAKQAADERGCPITLHASQSVVEFNEMLARHGKTPIAWLDELGFLGPRTILGHAIIVGRLVLGEPSRGRRPDHGRRRMLGRPRGVGVRAPGRPDGVVRPLPRGRCQHVARDGHEPPERHRGDALGGCALEDDGAEHPGDDGGRTSSTPPPSAGRGPSGATTSAASPPAPGPTSSSGRGGRGT